MSNDALLKVVADVGDAAQQMRSELKAELGKLAAQQGALDTRFTEFQQKALDKGPYEVGTHSPNPGARVIAQSIGGRILRDEGVRGLIARRGAPVSLEIATSIPMLCKSLLASREFGGASPTTGVDVGEYMTAGVANDLRRPLSVLEVIPRVPVMDANEATYHRLTGYTSAAGKQTPEGSAKPEAAVDLPAIRVPIETFAVTLPVTRQVLSDSPFLQSWIDSRLRFDVLAALENAVVDELIAGGTIFSGASSRHVDRLGEAIATMQSEGLRPDVVLLNPLDLFAIMAEVGTDGHYRMPQSWALAQPPALWGAAQVVWSASLTRGTGIVLDTSNSAVLFEREVLQILVGYDADGFSSNVLTFLAELRAGVDVVTPQGVRLVGSGSP